MPSNADGHHRDSQLRRNHPDAGLEGRDLAGPCHLAFRENQQTPFVVGQLADVAQGGERAGFALRDRKGIEEKRGEIVIQAIREAAAVKMFFEKFLAHRGRHAITPARGQRVQNRRHVHVALMIGGEDHRRLEILEILQAVRVDVREDTIERQQKSGQENAACGASRRASIPGGKIIGGPRRRRW